MFDPLGLNSATKHQIRHERLASIHDRESDHAVAPETVFAAQDESVQLRVGENCSQHLARVAVSGKIHLISALGQLVHPFQIVFRHLADSEPNLAMAKE